MHEVAIALFSILDQKSSSMTVKEGRVASFHDIWIEVKQKDKGIECEISLDNRLFE